MIFIIFFFLSESRGLRPSLFARRELWRDGGRAQEVLQLHEPDGIGKEHFLPLELSFFLKKKSWPYGPFKRSSNFIRTSLELS